MTNRELTLPVFFRLTAKKKKQSKDGTTEGA